MHKYVIFVVDQIQKYNLKHWFNGKKTSQTIFKKKVNEGQLTHNMICSRVRVVWYKNE